MEVKNSIPNNILKIQEKICKYEIGSRNYKKYKKILAKHVKKYSMTKRVNSNIKTIETINKLEEKINPN